MGVVIPLEEKSADRLIEPLTTLVAGDMARVNQTILSRTGSEVTMIPEVANHLISSGGKRLRPILTLATAGLCGYSGDGHIKLAAAVEFMHTATLLHDDVVDESDMRRGTGGRAGAVGQRGERAGRRFPARPGLQDDGGSRLAALPRRAVQRRRGDRRGRGDAALRRQGHRNDRGRLSRRHSRQDRGAVRRGLRGRAHSRRPRKAEIAACRGYGANLGIAFQLIDDALDYGGSSAKLGKNVGDDFREGKITLPVVLSFRRGATQEREFWRRTLEKGEVVDGDLEIALATMKKHRALEDTIERARHYGAMARDALELFAASPWKHALRDAVEFAISRAH